MAAGPISGITGGDIAEYMTSANDIFHLDFTSYLPWLNSYLKLGSTITSLPSFYVYASIQYLVLLIPTSIYFFLKVLFPKQTKTAGIGALFISVLYGLSSIPFIAKLATTPNLLPNFLNGAVQSTLGLYVKIFWANTQSYVLWDRTIEYGLCFFALGFLFMYFQKDTLNKKWRELLFRLSSDNRGNFYS